MSLSGHRRPGNLEVEQEGKPIQNSVSCVRLKSHKEMWKRNNFGFYPSHSTIKEVGDRRRVMGWCRVETGISWSIERGKSLQKAEVRPTCLRTATPILPSSLLPSLPPFLPLYLSSLPLSSTLSSFFPFLSSVSHLCHPG